MNNVIMYISYNDRYRNMCNGTRLKSFRYRRFDVHFPTFFRSWKHCDNNVVEERGLCFSTMNRNDVFCSLFAEFLSLMIPFTLYSVAR